MKDSKLTFYSSTEKKLSAQSKETSSMAWMCSGATRAFKRPPTCCATIKTIK